MKKRVAGSIVGLAVAIALTVGCGGDNDGAIRTVTVSPAEEDAQGTGDAILIETRISSAANHSGEVLSGSVIGESQFCPGGKTTGGSEGPLITTTFHCRDGVLKVSYSPTQHSLVQGAPWEVVSGTGRYKELRGGGSMVAKFRSDDPQQGGETFAGTVDE